MRLLGRLAEEMRAAPAEDEAERALAALRVQDAPIGETARELTGAEGVALVSASSEGEPLEAARPRDVVELAPGVYASIPGREARVRLLRALRAIAPRVILHVRVGDEGTHLGRIAFDAPRQALRAAGLARLPEPGDRFEGGYAHLFFDEEPLLVETAAAGLAPKARRGSTFLLEPRSEAATEVPAPFVVELARVLGAARAIERARLASSPEDALRTARARGVSHERRGPIARARLRRAISWVDAGMGANCYRRVLLELALDAGAANERVVLGLDVGSTGHAAFEHREDRTFDVAFVLGPDGH